MATFEWSDCPLVEIIPGKVSGVPLLRNTRLPVDAITGNYNAFRDEGLSAPSRQVSAIAPSISFRDPGRKQAVALGYLPLPKDVVTREQVLIMQIR